MPLYQKTVIGGDYDGKNPSSIILGVMSKLKN